MTPIRTNVPEGAGLDQREQARHTPPPGRTEDPQARGPAKAEEAASLQKLAGEWRALADAHGSGVPFQTWEWAAALESHFTERRFLVHDRTLTYALRSPGGDLVGVAPLMVTRRPAAGPGVRVVDFLGADPNVTELRGLLCDPAWEEAAVRALLERLLERRAEWDVLHLRGLRVGGAGHRLVEARAGVIWGRETPAYVLPLTGRWEQVKAGVSRNLKESLRHGYNSLKREGIAFELDVAREANEVGTALETFFRLHGARSRLTGTATHGNVFACAMVQEFLRDVCGRLCQRDMVRVFQLRIGGEVVASRVAFALGDTLYLYFSGCQPAWGRYAVMTTTVAEAVKYAIVNGFHRVHLSTGTDVSKTRWRPALTLHRDALLVSPSLRGRMAHRVLAAAGRTLSSPVFRRLLGRSFNAR